MNLYNAMYIYTNTVCIYIVRCANVYVGAYTLYNIHCIIQCTLYIVHLYKYEEIKHRI